MSASVSDWLRNGTLRITVPAAPAAPALSWAENSPSGNISSARAAVSRARSASRDPIAIGTPVRASRSERPKPSAPEAPITATGSRLFAGTRGEYRLRKMTSPGDAEPSPRPLLAPNGGLPASVSIREVGPRDGFQNEPETIPTAEKVELIEALARTGLPRIEVTAFVRADVIPQLADAEEVLDLRGDPQRRQRVGPDPQRARAGARAGAPRAGPDRRGERVPVRLGDPQPAQRQPLGGGVAGAGPGRARRRPRRRPALRGGDLDRLRLPLRGPRAPERVLEIAARATRGGRRGGRLRGHHRNGQPGAGRGLLQDRAGAARTGRSS